jgi:hypothetical protein
MIATPQRGTIMSGRSFRSTTFIALALLVSIALAGCSTAGFSPIPTASPSPSGSTVPSADPALCGSAPADLSPGASSACASPAPSASTTGFYLRTWQSQALAPQYTFGWTPSVTISGGQLVSGLVAVPAIYPGPIYIGPTSRTISDKGVAAIIAEAQKGGLLDGKTNYGQGIAPGSIVVHIRLVVGGIAHDYSGPAQASDAQPGAAFSSFWQRLHSLDSWLALELGKQEPYVPTAIAVMTKPVAEPQDGFTPQKTAWPLESTFAAFGIAYGDAGSRCGTVTGADLAKLLPILKVSNQLTRFHDTAGVEKSLQVRVLFPGENSPCA